MTHETSRSARMPKEQRREQVLAAAREVFVAEGFHAASMDTIAERAGVTKPVLYQHFPGKLDLYLALLDTAIDELVTGIGQAMRSTTDNNARVRATLNAYFGFVDASDGAFRLFFERDLRSDTQVNARVERAERAIAVQIAEIISADTGLNEQDAFLLGAGLQGLMESCARHWVQQVPSMDRARAVELAAQLAWRGIRAFPKTHPPVVQDDDH